LNWRTLPVYKVGHSYADFVAKVVHEYKEFAKAVFEANNQKYEDAILVFEELKNIGDKPPYFSQMFLEALRTKNLT